MGLDGLDLNNRLVEMSKSAKNIGQPDALSGETRCKRLYAGKQQHLQPSECQGGSNLVLLLVQETSNGWTGLTLIVDRYC